MNESAFDLMIVGTGPAGMTAALYAQRLGARTVVFGDIPGGNLYMIQNLSNFPGFPEGIGGTDFGIKLFQQAQSEGALFTMARLKTLSQTDDGFQGIDDNGQVYRSPAAVIATGRVPVPLPAANSNMAGIHFCSVCDGPLYRGKSATLAVIGSDNTAAQHALTLSAVCETTYLIFRSQTALMDAAHRSRLEQQGNVKILSGTEAVDFVGSDRVEAIQIRSAGGQRSLPVEGVFLAVGWCPNTEMIDFDVATTTDGYLRTEGLMTSVEGLFAAGDIRDSDLYQVLTASADGARAARHAVVYLSKKWQ